MKTLTIETDDDLARRLARDELGITDPSVDELHVIRSSYLFALARVGTSWKAVCRDAREALREDLEPDGWDLTFLVPAVLALAVLVIIGWPS